MVTSRVLPPLAFGAFAGTGLVALPVPSGLLIFGVPLALWTIARAGIWRTQPRSRAATVAAALGALAPIIAATLTTVPLPRCDELAGVCW